MNASNPVLELCADLIRRKSVTPDDAGCQAVLAERLGALGFRCESIMSNGVTNLWARWGTAKPLVVFAGHTDVVPPGPLEHWRTPPFEPTLDNDQLYGRGAADMKASLAAFVVAVEEFVRAYPTVAGSIALLITSDEEGPATDGTAKVCSILQQRGELPDYCLVGEPTSTQQLGDTIKNGRRGSLSGYLTVHGVQGHVAYPHLARNPIHQLAPALAELVAIEWDSGNEYFPATTFQIANLQAGTGATNVIPGQAQLMFNFRYAPVSTADDLQARVAEVLDRYGLSYDLRWVLSGEPFLTPRGTLSEALMAAIRDETGLLAELSTSGGTSDGRFIAKICEQVVEFGPINASIHQVNEHVAVSALLPLKNIYRRTLERLLLTHS